MNRSRLGVITRVSPDVFAIVMATGIVSVAATRHDHRVVGDLAGWLATIVFGGLLVAAGCKILSRPDQVRAELNDPGRVFGMFTFVAAACVLSVHWAGHGWAVAGLIVAAAVAWVGFLTATLRVVAHTPLRGLRDHARGGWLLISVATSALAIAAARTAVRWQRPGLVGVAATLWVLAVLLYLVVATLIVSRARTSTRPTEIATPDGWILMGALAIATLAAATVHHATGVLPALADRRDLAGVVDTVTWWAATGWIPFLAVIHVRVLTSPRRRRQGFVNPWWSAVFPAGMYATASAMVGSELPNRAISTVSDVALWVAYAAWIITAIAMGRTALRWWRADDGGAPGTTDAATPGAPELG